ncbi:MAG: tetratricopeptide repeat protein [Bacteroidia bacterium]
MLELTSSRKGSTFFLLVVGMILLASCGKERKNIVARSYHATNSFFNGYYNATRLLKATRDQLEESYEFEDNTLIDIYVYPDSSEASAAEADMEKVTEKDDVIIFKHPNGGFEDDCRLLTGISYFYRRDWEEARKHFKYVIELEKSKRTPEAQIWYAMSYFEEGQQELAADYLQEHIFAYDTVKIKPRIRGRLAALGSTLAVDTANYEAAASLLAENIKNVSGRRNKTEAYFLLGQLHDKAESYPEALEAFAKVQRMSKNYEFVFLSKMKTADLYTKYQGGKDDENLVYEYLAKLLKDPKNRPYHDRIYYQFGQLAVKKDSLDAAIGHFRKAIAGGDHARTKALSGFAAGNIFFREKLLYDSAQVYYDIAASAVSPDAPEYEEITTLAAVLRKYVEYKTTITYQDSMLWLASLPEDKQKEAVGKVIAIEKEKARKAEEARLAKQRAEEQALASARGSFGGSAADRFNDQLNGRNSRRGNSNFYFDNPSAVSQGQQQFAQRWGNRANEDDWRRVAKAATFDNKEEQIAAAKLDSVQRVKDSVLVKEFGDDYKYYKNIPRNDTMVQESKDMIETAMYKLGHLYFQRLNEADSAIKTFEGLLDRFDPSNYDLEARYALYQIYKKLDNPLQYVHYNYIVNEHPQTVYAYLLQGKDPRDLDRIEDDYLFAYTGLFASYRDRQYETAIGFGDFLLAQFANNPQLDMAELQYIRGMSYGYLGQKDSLRSILTYVVTTFPESDVTPPARLTLQYMQRELGVGGPPPLPSSKDRNEDASKKPELADVNNPRYRDFGNPPKSGEKIFVLMFVDQEAAKAMGLIKNAINAKIGDFNKKDYPKLKPFTFVYNNKTLLPYVSHFASPGDALGYINSFKNSAAGKEILSVPGSRVFYISHGNFKVAYGRKRLEDYMLYYDNIVEKG